MAPLKAGEEKIVYVIGMQFNLSCFPDDAVRVS
jgi:hypothetical protein